MRNLTDVRETAKRCGNVWFSAESMRYHNSRISESLTRVGRDGSVWFISSERDTSPYQAPQPRLYTVRKASVSYTPCRWDARELFRSWSHFGEYGERVSRSENPELADDPSPVWGISFTIDTVGEFQGHATSKEAYRAMVRAMREGN